MPAPHRLIVRTRDFGRYVRIVGWKLLIRHPRISFRRYREWRLLLGAAAFDPDYYQRENPDVAASGVDPALHFLMHGAMEGRDPSTSFATASYRAVYTDVFESGANPLVHFLRFGANEGRMARPVPMRKAREVAAPNPLPRDACIFVTGEARDRPSYTYRVQHFADATRRLGEETFILDVCELERHAEALKTARMVFISRAQWSPEIETAIRLAKDHSVPVIFDIDDLMFRPDLARPEYIDAIRFNAYDEEAVGEHFDRVLSVLRASDFCTSTTEELAWQMRQQGNRVPVVVLENGFSESTYALSRQAARERATGNDGIVRIGYASGSRTHQADFAQCAAGVAAILRKHPHCRLVLFQQDDLVTLDPAEFPEFAGLEERIEWRTFVALESLPLEVARFDINLAPLEAGNPFCEAKSDLKFFEAAIAGVPTVASPTGPMKRAIQHGKSGFLASSAGEWEECLGMLVEDSALRARLADEAHRDVLWRNGPLRRTNAMSLLLDQVEGGLRAARAFKLQAEIAHSPSVNIALAEREILFEKSADRAGRVTVVVPLYNYEDYIEEALDSAAAQTLPDIDLVVLDDCSTDRSGARTLAWMKRNIERFNRIVLARHLENQGLGSARNTAFDLSDTLYVMALDADNRLLPACCEKLFQAAETRPAAFVYPDIQQFGEAAFRMGDTGYHPGCLVTGNYIDAMALISREAWARVGGFTPDRHGWEDFDLWCRFVESGLVGDHVPEILAEYRVHGASMLRTTVDHLKNKTKLIAWMEGLYPWLSLDLDERGGYRDPIVAGKADGPPAP